jgi:copper resistance protein B
MTEARCTGFLIAGLALLPLLASGTEANGLSMHMDDNPWQATVLFDQLEWQDAEEGGALAWDVDAWAGNDDQRLLLRAEGERVDGETGENRLELLWWQPVTRRWNVVAGLRQDFEPGPARTFAALGVQGLAPGWVHVEATAYLGERGQSGMALKAGPDLLLTNRLFLAPLVELEAWGRDDVANGIGSGLARVTLGLRLRYEIRRKFAPYVGVEWAGKVGDSADLARQADESVRDARWLAGVRAWF